MPLPAFRQNVTDDQQEKLETAEHDNGIPVFTDAETRIISRGSRTAPQRVAGSGGGVPDQGNSAGVIMPHDDAPGRFIGEQIGRA